MAIDMAKGNVRVSVDVGGTFTDVFVLDEDGETHVAKVPSSPADPMDGVLRGVAAAGIDWHRVSFFSHGTTIATNALITRNFPTRRDGHDGRLSRRDRDPPRQPRRPLGHLQGDRAPLHRAAQPARRRGAHGLFGQGPHARERCAGARGGARDREARDQDGRRLLRERVRQPRERGSHARDPAGGARRGCRHHDFQRGPAGDLRARTLLDHGCERGALSDHQAVRRATRRPAQGTAATPRTCCSCTRAAAS